MATENIPRLVSANELEQLAPDLYTLYQDHLEQEDDGEYDDEEETTDFIYFDGSTRLTPEQYHAFRDQLGYYVPLAVNGDLHVAGSFSSRVLINGDLHCDVFNGGKGIMQIKGTLFARHRAVFMAEDHEMLCNGGSFRLETPYVFSWFCDLTYLELSAATVVFILCDHSDYTSMGLINPHFFWQDDVFALRPELCYAVGCRYSDAPYWNWDAIDKAQKAGESLFIKDFDISSLGLNRQAAEYHQQKRHAEAFALYRQSTEVSPGYYFAWLGAGRMLFLSGPTSKLSFGWSAPPVFSPKNKKT